MAALFGQGELARLCLVEIDAPLHQFHDPLRRFANGQFHDMAVRQLVAGDHGVFDVFLVSIWTIHHCSHATLGVLGRGIIHFCFGNNANFAVISGLQGEAEACHARANDQKIDFLAGFVHRDGIYIRLELQKYASFTNNDSIAKKEKEILYFCKRIHQNPIC